VSKAEKAESNPDRKNAFHEKIRDKDKAFVLFYATWCPFSLRFLPIFEEYSKRNPEACLSIIVDEEPDLCEECTIEYYPTVIMFKKGRLHKRLDSKPGVGLNKKQLEDFTKEQ